MTNDNPLHLDVSDPSDERRWLVLYEEDYENVMLDAEDQVALLVDIEQAGELVRLGATAIASLSHLDAEADDVIEDLIDALERELSDGGEDD